MKILFLTALFSTSLFAGDLAKRPPAFETSQGTAVFGDFTDAHYSLTYDVSKKAATAVAQIKLTTAEKGHILFDSQVEPTRIFVDGEESSQTLIQTPGKETSVRLIRTETEAGDHVLKIELPVTQLVEFSGDGVKSAFWMTDLTDRGYLERYLPTNFLFDRIPVTLNVKFIGASGGQRIYANGVVSKISDSEFTVAYRAEFNTSCIYFHTVPATAVEENRFMYKSVDGREIPAVVYVAKDFLPQTDRLEKLKNQILSILAELEGDYGAFLHPSVTVYVAGSGGMEYSGATMTSENALGHELFHSYFARGVMPSDGNAGWIDEALASWRDYGYNTLTSMSGTSNMGNHGTYARTTDRLAYTFGERFMAYLDGKLTGGLKPFLREMVKEHAFEPLNVGDFEGYMSAFYGEDVSHEFRLYVFGENATVTVPFRTPEIHRQHSMAELRNLL